MGVFDQAYAKYYELLYRDKDYAGEVAFVKDLLDRHAPKTRSVLELGCGGGKHAALLAEAGLSVHGVDLSEGMLEEARRRAASLTPDVTARLAFSPGDVRSVRVGRRFDAVISLFHVFSYQTTNDDLHAVFMTTHEHLKEGGILIFDAWYGPAVLTDRPSVRIKRMEDEHIQMTRLAEPTLHPERNMVDVHYQVFIRERNSDIVHETREIHSMRYLFTPEVQMLMQDTGFELLESKEWLTGCAPSFDTWAVCFVAKCKSTKQALSSR